MRLEKMVEEVLPLHKKVWRPKHIKIQIPTQTYFNGQYPNKNKRGQLLGFFYENVSRALYGGELNDRKYDFLFNGVPSGTKPDVIDGVSNISIESKATVSGDALEIDEIQFRGMEYGQYRMPERRFFYAVCRHTLKGIKKQKRTEEEIIEGLSEKTSFSVVLPLSVLIALSEIRGNGMVSDYTNRQTSYNDCFCIRSPTINRFLTEPENLLEDIELNPGEFSIERYISQRNLSVNEKRLKRFPMVRIYDKNHEQWVGRFMRDYEARMGRQDLGVTDLPIFEHEEMSGELEEVPFD